MENTEFKFIEIEDYLKLNSVKDLSQEQKDEIVRVRTTLELMSPEQFNFLKEQGIIVRTRKLRKLRSLWVCENGKIWYFCHYGKKYQYAGYFKEDE